MKSIKRTMAAGLLICLLLMLSACSLAFSSSNRITATTTGEEYRDWQNAYAQDGRYAVSAEGLHSVQLNWLAGEVSVAPGEGEDVRLVETAENPIPAEDALRYGVEDGVLYIQYCAVGRDELPTKKLELTLPATLADGLQRMRADVVSAQTTMKGLTTQELAFFGSSGGLTATDMRAATVRLESVSGGLSYEGAYQQLAASASSGGIAVQGTSDSTVGSALPGDVTLNTVSGGVSFGGTYRQITASTSSGAIAVESRGKAEKTKLSSISGGVAVSGATGDTEVSTSSGGIAAVAETSRWQSQSISGAVSLTFATCPDQLSVSTSSGDVTLTLPEQSDFTLEYASSSGRLQSDFPMTSKGNTHVCGAGAAQWTVSTTSGDCRLVTVK